MAPTTGDGRPRYPKRDIAGVSGAESPADLGIAMQPREVYTWLNQVARLSDDEVMAAFAAGARRLERDLGPDPAVPGSPALGVLPVGERLAALDEARAVTRSRLAAWRRRHREMTWRELRMLFLGLRENPL